MKPRPSLVGLAFVSGLMLQITAQCEPSETATAAASIAPAVIIRGSDSMIDMVNRLARRFHEISFPLPTVTSGVGVAALADATADIAFTKSAAGQKIVEESGLSPLPADKTAQQKKPGCTKCRIMTGLLGGAGALLAFGAWRVTHSRLRRKPS